MGSASAKTCDVLKVTGNPAQPPLVWKQGKSVTGAAIELAEMVIHGMGLKMRALHMGPLARVQKQAERGQVDVVSGVFKNEEFQEYLVYANAPFIKSQIAAFTLRSNPLVIDTWGDMIGYQGGTIRGASYGRKFNRFVKKNLTLNKSPRLEMLFGQLQKGRVDFILYQITPGLSVAEEMGIGGQVQFFLPRPAIQLNIYIAMAKSSPCIHLLPNLNREVRKIMVRQGPNLPGLWTKYNNLWNQSQKQSKAQP